MPGGAVHTVHKQGKWFNEVEKSGTTLGDGYERREDAVRAGRDAARERHVEHMIHGLDGRIHERSSYGHDPRNVPG